MELSHSRFKDEEKKGRPTDLYEDALEVLRHRDAAELDAKVAEFEARSLGLDLGLLLAGVDGGELLHEEVEQAVGHQRHRLGAGLQDGEDRRGLLRVVEDVHGTRRLARETLCKEKRRKIAIFTII